ncbi:MAG: chromosome segregation protein, partial [Acetobacteraceae bacterium]|nr:chromosome segregation protein [Acetobacteraceae bacterium]
MPVSFRRMRIAGFKSFAEPISVEILPGLTGIVGPNGCGKSNVVEALRWAMGESSARNLRGGEMEDVIFAGTAGRASRNIAEVTLYLDEAVGRAPPPFHEQPELEIARRIERGSGSAYRINGREARARDVQTLFADLASGSRASAMVSQGRVGALVGAKPEERRAVLEEAANITGLHARRHEAELKLRAAETNMARAEDLRAQLESQLGNLKRQARQASRYRNISGAIRTAEAELLALQRARVEQVRAQAAAALHDAEIAVAAATDAATAATSHAAEANAALPPLREDEANARTLLERYRVSQEQIAGEEQAARVALGEAQRRIGQLRQDLAHASQLQRDAASAGERLAAEETALAEADAGHDERATAAETAAVAAGDAVRVAEAEANRAIETAAEANARAQAAAALLTQAEHRSNRLNEQFRTIG